MFKIKNLNFLGKKFENKSDKIRLKLKKVM